MTIGIDLDGTLLNYCNTSDLDIPQPINYPVVDALAARGEDVAIITIQGGLNFAGSQRSDGGAYPTPWLFVLRLSLGLVALRNAGVKVSDVRVCVYHPRAKPATVQRVAHQVRKLLSAALAETCTFTVYTTERARKPNPTMLAGVTEYWGDSPEDMRAARNAGVPYRFVPRFIEGGGAFDWSHEKMDAEDRTLFASVFPMLDGRCPGWTLAPDGLINGYGYFLKDWLHYVAAIPAAVA